MRPIYDAHVEQPGLAVVEVVAADDATAFAVQDLLAKHCAIAPAAPAGPCPDPAARRCAPPSGCVPRSRALVRAPGRRRSRDALRGPGHCAVPRDGGGARDRSSARAGRGRGTRLVHHTMGKCVPRSPRTLPTPSVPGAGVEVRYF
ncbi:DUF6207 family protein [Streptomyces sp. NRRL B-24085]|uniref:DUF6207 family protein n=1 Tax=Streptomyces sp. NRRL B-24085 TaxID=1709476 RepID=UPI0006B31CB7|nr:DUF6207 family protein [Streptomyces sp. NRRL B-24085]